MLSIRLDKKTENQLEYTSQRLGISKSELVRESLVEYLIKLEQSSAWEIGKDLFGKHKSGDGKLSEAQSSTIKAKIKARKK